ncbi:MAG: hypothetical protein AAGA85_14530 [Bacteroidota bacterium]
MKLSPNPYNLIVPIKPGEKDALMAKLEIMQDDLYDNPLLPFRQIKSIHFARFVILHEAGDFPDQLVFSTNYDGMLDSHLKEILNCPEADIDQVLGHCKGYPDGSEGDKIRWLKDNAKLRAYFYRGTWGMSREHIISTERLRKIAEAKIDELTGQELSAQELRNAIAETVKKDSEFRTYPEYKVPNFNLWEILKLLVIAVVILVLLPFFLIVLLAHEIADDKREYDKKYSDNDRTREFVSREDKIVQNQLTHLVDIKPGWFRLMTLKFVLNGIAYLAKYWFNKGKLGSIPTIHYARWIIIDKGKRLLFFSNFDGSWESYLGDFVDKAAVGLTGVWSNTVEFPKTRGLVFRGARDEQRFKSWTRSKQHITHVWFSAYPDLTVTNIANNKALHEGLTHDLSQKEIEEWLLRY